MKLHQKNEVLHNRPPPRSEKTSNKNQKLGPFWDHQLFPKGIGQKARTPLNTPEIKEMCSVPSEKPVEIKYIENQCNC